MRPEGITMGSSKDRTASVFTVAQSRQRALGASRELGSVAVIGGGIAGLAVAHFLSTLGVKVTLFEGSGEFGGLGSAFEYEGIHLERFYHCMLPSDKALLALLSDLGIAGDVYWKQTSFGVYASDRVYPLNSPMDLLKFHSLPLQDRLRLGLTGLYARQCSADGLDDVTCESWLRRLSGPRGFETFWRPLLEAKFGERYSDVPALWFWTRLNREKGGAVERKGYIRGGYRRIVDCLVESLQRRGQTLHLRSPVEALGVDERRRPRLRVPGGEWQTFDRLVFAGPLAALRGAAERGGLGGAMGAAGVQDVDMMGVVNVVLICRQRLTPHYWIAVPDREIAFQGIVENTNLIDGDDAGGVQLIHLVRYTHRSEALYACSDDEVLNAFLSGLRRMFPDLSLPTEGNRFVFRTPFVEPLYTCGYLSKRPSAELVPRAIYLATSAQVYPQVTSWNGSVELARKVADLMLGGCNG
jgi:protoporphyrinogen oxidase